jgi:hypothetical protein
VNRKLGRATAVAALAVLLALALAACGGDDDSDAVASLTDTAGQTTTEKDSGSTASPDDRREAELEFAKCMREHGVDFPDPVDGRFEFRSERGEEAKVAEAQEACRPILQYVAPAPLDEEQQAVQREAALEFAKCMREHGVDMPDPEFTDDGGMLMRMPEGAEDDPKIEEAQKACQPILDPARPEGAPGEGEES